MALDDPGVIRRIDPTELIRWIGWNGVAAVRAVTHADINGHAARRATDMVAVVAIVLYWTWSEAHARLLSFSLAIWGVASSCQLPYFLLRHALILPPRAFTSLYVLIAKTVVTICEKLLIC